MPLYSRSNKKSIATSVSKARFFSIVMDGSTDKGNIDDELFLVLWCDIDSREERVLTEMSYLSVSRPKAVTGKGLL